MRMLQGLRAAAVGTATGLAVTLLGVYAYSFLGGANLRFAPEVPWGPALAVPLLWLYWRWLGGEGPPRAAAGYRRRMRRANPIPPGARRPVAAAGLAGLAFAGSAMTLGFRLSDLPADAFRPPPLPAWTLAPAVVMLSLVAGVCEEVGMRGYLQRPLEEAGFPAAAVGWSAAAFVFLHTNREGFLAQAGPMFLTALWYGWYTARSGSIYPMVAVHALLDVAAFGYLWVLGGSPPGSVLRDGLTPAFWLNLAVAAVTLVLALVLTARIPASEERRSGAVRGAEEAGDGDATPAEETGTGMGDAGVS
jgi:membrane protease YdiL (CAAX protease family)